MKSRYIFIGILLSILGVAIILQYAPVRLHWLIYIVSVVALLLLLLLWRGVLMPAQTVVKGMELIKAQDFNNRLRPVHQRESDRIVDLFNQMIDKLRNERLYNREQDGFLKLLIEASPMGVVMLDFDGKVSMMNNSFLRITGIPNQEAGTGLKVTDLPSGLARKMTEVPLGENLIIRHGDVKMYRCYHLSFIQTGFQRHFYLLESLTEEVMKAERAAYEKVIRIMSHEVNNTMGGVRSVLEMLNDIVDDDDIKEVIDSCDDRCSQMCGFISSYADVVRVPEPVLRKVDLSEELHRLMPFLQEMVPERIRLEYNPPTEPIDANIDTTLMQQVVVNVVKNAVESIKGEGIIRISAGIENENVLLEISNDGEPISEEVSRNLFSPFFTTKKEGRGLGLTLISEILNKHKAQFSLMTGEDGITRFRIRL